MYKESRQHVVLRNTWRKQSTIHWFVKETCDRAFATEELSATCSAFPLLVVEVEGTDFSFGFICWHIRCSCWTFWTEIPCHGDSFPWTFLLVKIIIVTSAPLAPKLIAGFVLIYQNYLQWRKQTNSSLHSVGICQKKKTVKKREPGNCQSASFRNDY